MKKIIKWIRIYVFRRITVLDILEYSDVHRADGLCDTFSGACSHYEVNKSDFLDKCTEFNATIAAERFNGTGKPWWWIAGVWHTGREEYLHYLLTYYRKEKPIYLKHYWSK